ncbi:MAG: YIP1 family protein [Bacteroidota bacterium]|nr:YIP1 family protein [Bacteroidota bacterium]
MNIKCPHCKKIFDVSQADFGNSVVCTHCNNEFLIDTKYLPHLEKSEKKKPLFNVWFLILFKPRSTIKRIVEEKPKYGLIIIIFIYGISNFLDSVVNLNIGDYFGLWGVIFLSVILGPIIAITVFYIQSGFLGGCGRMLKGKANDNEILTVAIWAHYPLCIPLILSIILNFIYFKTRMYIHGIGQREIIDMVSGVLFLVFGFWSLFIFIQGIKEVHGFGFFKSIITIVFSWMLLLISLIIIAGICCFFILF